MRHLLETLFLRNYACYVTWRWPQVGGVFNSAVFLTALWLTLVLVAVFVWALTGLAQLVPDLPNPVRGPSWLLVGIWLLIYVWCDHKITSVAAAYRTGVSQSVIVAFSTSRERLVWWLQVTSLLAFATLIAVALSIGP